jgi:hypothetical protein
VPVSSPSYFPPNSSTDQVKGINAGRLATGAPSFLAGANAGNNSTTASLIIIGDNAGTAGITDNNLAGTILMGGNAGKSLTTGIAAGTPGANTIVGFNAATNLKFGGQNVIMGDNAFASVVGAVGGNSSDENVIIGSSAGQFLNSSGGAAQRSINNVIIGAQACKSAAGSFVVQSNNNIIVGFQAALNGAVNGGTFGGNIILGTQAGTVAGDGFTFTNTVIIGQNSTATLNAANNSVYIGAVITNGNSGSTQELRNTVIGATCSLTGKQDCVMLGAGCAGIAANEGFILIGSGAGQIFPAGTLSSSLTIECAQTGLVGAFVYGNLVTGNYVIGNSGAGNRDFGGVAGTNMLKLLNGTKAAGANIIGGGYFTVQAGILTWIDQNGIQTQLSNSTAGDLIDSANVALTNNAGAQVATILNGPLAGNPTKWIPINDNGTIRNIPAW